MLRKLYQAMIYSRMLTALSRIPPRILEDMGLADLDARRERAYEMAYGRPRIAYDGL